MSRTPEYTSKPPSRESEGDRESHMQYRIGVMEGDDIGLEIVLLTVTIMEAAIAREPGLDVAFQRFPVGWTSYLEHGHTLPQTTLDGLANDGEAGEADRLPQVVRASRSCDYPRNE